MSSRISKSLSALIVIFSVGVAVALASSVRPIQGPVILARGGRTAAYIWDATQYVMRLRSDRSLGSAGMRAVEATAVSALAQKARSSRAESLAITVIYRPLSPMSIYGKPVFAGEQKLLVVTVSRSGALKDGAGWAQSVAGGRVPPQVKISVMQTLPPR